MQASELHKVENICVTKEIMTTDLFVEELISNPELIHDKYANILSVEQRQIRDKNNMVLDGRNYTEMDCENYEYVATLTRMTFAINDQDGEVADYYVMSVSTDTKTSTGSLTQDGVTLNGSIGWIDYFGPINEFVYASGSRNGTYSEEGYYQVLRGTGTLCSGNFSSSFYATSNLSDKTGSEFRLYIRSKSSQTNKNVILEFTTSIWD